MDRTDTVVAIIDDHARGRDAMAALAAEQFPAMATILEEHDAHDMWRPGAWSFNRIGSEGSGEG